MAGKRGHPPLFEVLQQHPPKGLHTPRQGLVENKPNRYRSGLYGSNGENGEDSDGVATESKGDQKKADQKKAAPVAAVITEPKPAPAAPVERVPDTAHAIRVMREAAKIEAAKRKAERREASRQEAAKRAAAKREASRLQSIERDAARQEAAMVKAGEREAARVKGAEREAAAHEASKLRAIERAAAKPKLKAVKVEVPAQPVAAVATATVPVVGGGRPGSIQISDGVVTIPVTQLYVGAAVMLAVMVLLWGVATNMGASARERELTANFGAGSDVSPRPIEPLAHALTTKDPTAARPRTGVASRRTKTPVAEPKIKPESILMASGALFSDPRQGGMNYMEIVGSRAAIGQDEALGLISFLDSEGLEGVALPVIDRNTGRVNNPPRYRILLLSGAVTGDQYGASQAERAVLESRVSILGETWLRERGGSTNLAHPLWRKYQP